jgi:hypothetical protein
MQPMAYQFEFTPTGQSLIASHTYSPHERLATLYVSYQRIDPWTAMERRDQERILRVRGSRSGPLSGRPSVS